MTSLYKEKEDLMKSLLAGSKKLADNVGATLGPKGHNVMLQKEGHSPLITKDGVTVAQYIKSDCHFEQMAIDIVRQASEQTNIIAGDGTSTSTIIADAILRESNKHIVNDHHPFELKRGIDKMVEKIVQKIKLKAIPIDSLETIESVASIASNGDSIAAKLIAQAVDQVGRDGAITIVEGKTRDTKLEIVEGFTFDSGIYNSAFVTDERTGVCKCDGPLLLITDYKISNLEELIPALEIVARSNKPLVIVASDYDGSGLAALILNQTQNKLKIAAIKAPRYGNERKGILEDLCISSGATFIKRDSGLSLKDIKLEHFGQAKMIESNKRATVVVDPKGDPEAINKRIEFLKDEIKVEENIDVAKTLQERVTRLASAIAIIKVGANTEIEAKEKKHRIEDALEAVLAAQDEGVVPGGGTTLINIAEELKNLKFDTESETIGGKILLKAIQEPFKRLCENASLSYRYYYERLKKNKGKGYNFKTNKFADLMEDGVVDPARVTISCVKNAASAAGTLLTTSHGVVCL